MPLFSWTCKECNKEIEEILKIRELDEFIPECEYCGSNNLRKNIDMFARTPMRYGDGRSYYDHGLGMTIENSMHREKVMEEKGLVPVTKQVEEKQRYDMETTINKAADHEKRNGSSESVEKIKSSINKI